METACPPNLKTVTCLLRILWREKGNDRSFELSSRPHFVVVWKTQASYRVHSLRDVLYQYEYKIVNWIDRIYQHTVHVHVITMKFLLNHIFSAATSWISPSHWQKRTRSSHCIVATKASDSIRNSTAKTIWIELQFSYCRARRHFCIVRSGTLAAYIPDKRFKGRSPPPPPSSQCRASINFPTEVVPKSGNFCSSLTRIPTPSVSYKLS